MVATTAASSLLFSENELKNRKIQAGQDSDSDESTVSLPMSSRSVSAASDDDDKPTSSGSVEMDKHFENEDKDFLWTLTEEPHRSRRMQIMKDYPQVTKLMGYEPLTKYTVLLVVGIQLFACYYLRNTSPLSLKFFLTAYIVGATANQNLFMAIHEITHNLAFKSMQANRLLAMFANWPIGIPYAMMFKKYHIEHHKFLGEDGIDTDLPSRIEAFILSPPSYPLLGVLGKTFFATFQILFYALRPGMIRSQQLTRWHALNFLSQFLFDFIMIKYTPCGWNALIYMLASSFLAGSLHPCAGHFIAEHYVLDEVLEKHQKQNQSVTEWKDRVVAQETASYYGPLNALTYNVGYHQEHHDFPAIPWTRLPKLRAMARPYYDQYYDHPSWPMVTFNFIFHDANGLWNRVKRPGKQEREQHLFEKRENTELQGGTGSYGGLKDYEER